MFALLLAAAVSAVPSPPVPVQYVTDTQGVLSSQTVSSVDAELRSYERTTGHQIIVYIGGTTAGEPLEQWTVDTTERWGIGRKGHDDGAVLFLMMQDHRVRIEVGYGLEPYLTDAQTFWIIENVITPQLRAGNVDGAVQDGVDHILTTVTPSFATQIGHTVSAPEASVEDQGSGVGGALLPFIIFFCFFWVVLLLIFVAGVRYLVALVTHGPKAAAQAWHNTWVSSRTGHGGMFWGAPMLWGPGLGFGGGFGGGGFGGFSAGGGGFGGGGASGSW